MTGYSIEWPIIHINLNLSQNLKYEPTPNIIFLDVTPLFYNTNVSPNTTFSQAPNYVKVIIKNF